MFVLLATLLLLALTSEDTSWLAQSSFAYASLLFCLFVACEVFLMFLFGHEVRKYLRPKNLCARLGVADCL